MDTDRTRDRSSTFTQGISRRTALGRLAGAGVAAALLATVGRDNAQAKAQATPGLRREEPNHFVLAGGETQITYTWATEDGVPQLTYQGPFVGSRTFVGNDVHTQGSALGRLVTVNLGPFPDVGELWGTLLLPRFLPMTIWDAPTPFTTLAIEKRLISTIAGPPREGALEDYKVVTLEGTAQFVTPLPEGVTAAELSVASLKSGHDVPPTVDTLAMARVTFPPGAAVTAMNGAHLFVVESGALTLKWYLGVGNPPPGTPGPDYVDLPGGPSVYTAGDQLLVSYVETPPLAITNEGTEPAVALVVSLAATGGNPIGESLTGGVVVEPLAVAAAAQVGPPLLPADTSGAARISVALVRVNYEREASVDTLDILEPAVSLLAVESGALNVLVADPGLLTPVDGAPKQLPSDTRVSLVPGDQLLVSAPGKISTRNVARGSSAALIVTIGTTPAASS